MAARFRRIASTLVLAAVTAVAEGADAATPAGYLEQAEQALVSLDYNSANRIAAGLVQARGLTHDQLVRAYRILALTDAVLDRQAQAKDDFVRLLTFDPSYKGDPNLGPKVSGPFLEARGFMRAQAVQPGVEVAVVLRPNEPGTIRVTTRDPTHLARRAVVGERWGGEGAFETTPVAIGEGATAMVPPPPLGTTRLDWYVQILDERDNVVFEAGDPQVPKSSTVDVAAPATPPAPAADATPPPESHDEHRTLFESPLFWIVGGVLVAGAVTSVYVATHGASAASPTSANLMPSLQCGNMRCD